MTTAIVIIFLLGYLLIALESVTKVNKTAIALLMSVAAWTVYYVGTEAGTTDAVPFASYLGETCETLFFLMGAMTIVEVVDTYRGFDFVRNRLLTRHKRTLLWRITLITFFLSAVLDNLTTAIVMIMVLRKIVEDKNDRMLLACMVIMAANSGGAFSPIGDVTTIMLWVKGNITSTGVITGLFLPSIASVVVPALLMQKHFTGSFSGTPVSPDEEEIGASGLTMRSERAAVFCVGVGGLLSVPLFRMWTGLPPFMGILLVLAVLWIITELFFYKNRFHQDEGMTFQLRVSTLLHKIDLGTILFFLGILMTVSALTQTGVLQATGVKLDALSHGNPYVVTGLIGLLSAVVDNVPLVAACMGMYDLIPLSADLVGTQINYVVDGAFWELLAYCAGVGGSILIIGSAAGVVVMGLENISFVWYLKRFSLWALLGYAAGMGVYAIQTLMW